MLLFLQLCSKMSTNPVPFWSRWAVFSNCFNVFLNSTRHCRDLIPWALARIPHNIDLVFTKLVKLWKLSCVSQWAADPAPHQLTAGAECPRAVVVEWLHNAWMAPLPTAPFTTTSWCSVAGYQPCLPWQRYSAELSSCLFSSRLGLVAQPLN